MQQATHIICGIGEQTGLPCIDHLPILGVGMCSVQCMFQCASQHRQGREAHCCRSAGQRMGHCSRRLGHRLHSVAGYPCFQGLTQAARPFLGLTEVHIEQFGTHLYGANDFDTVVTCFDAHIVSWLGGNHILLRRQRGDGSGQVFIKELHCIRRIRSPFSVFSRGQHG